ncbi:hypothetical protein MVLG_05502 [Microbotryum lychnidis-dioicae p1A1 Lamole]|uniref:Uncharacterized protein n=1 Tax=Microbotryum lychnidis-dioicae (strain p1A1 Lamole / MvSl-1064) TaxID=683840 RepID=U5HEF8_USTV1|nr:hypothetical protein MVLG_05502 [Microbotryum lychnidis-dioicae p1A1 Lamole]|eukprot:KDE04063.1 hypothetical protein MVLG_05502 [Microbotryum lychnidis-dioicae p1A1 Lamole]
MAALGAMRVVPRARTTENDVGFAFAAFLAAGLEGATADLLDHYASITEGDATAASRPYMVQLANVPDQAYQTPANALVLIKRGADVDSQNVVASIAFEYKRETVHHTVATVARTDPPPEIRELDYPLPVGLQNLETERSEGADSVATKAIIHCVHHDCRFFVLLSTGFFQIGEVVKHLPSGAATASDASVSTAAASSSTAAASSSTLYTQTPTSPPSLGTITTEAIVEPAVRPSYSLLVQELARAVEPHPGAVDRAAEVRGLDLPKRSFFVSFITLAFAAVKDVPEPEHATVQQLLGAKLVPSNWCRPPLGSDSDCEDEPDRKARKTSANDIIARRSSRRLVGLASTESSLSTLSPSGLRPRSKAITVVQDRDFLIRARLTNAHWSTMSYMGTSRVDLVEIEFDIVSSPSYSPVPSRLSSSPSPARDFIQGLPLSDAVLQWLSKDPREELTEELTDARLPLSSPDPFEAHVELRLEVLVGTGRTAGDWLAKPMRINGHEFCRLLRWWTMVRD